MDIVVYLAIAATCVVVWLSFSAFFSYTFGRLRDVDEEDTLMVIVLSVFWPLWIWLVGSLLVLACPFSVIYAILKKAFTAGMNNKVLK